MADSETYPERIRAFAEAQFPKHQVDRITDHLIEVATGNIPGSRWDYDALDRIFAEEWVVEVRDPDTGEWEDLGEGTWPTAETAQAFAETEVGMEYRVEPYRSNPPRDLAGTAVGLGILGLIGFAALRGRS